MSYEDIKPGYKRTEVGVIPEDWDISTLKSLLSTMRNGAVYVASKNGGFPISRIETISSGKINYAKVGYATGSDQLKNYFLEAGDLLFSHINSLDHIGKVAIYKGDQPLYHGMNLLMLRAGDSIIPGYLYYWLSSINGRRRVAVLAKQAVSQASISTGDLRMLCLPIPKINEQIQIVEVLNDIENLLVKLDQLLEKKRALKQATMQQLLTGQTRLPGFSGEWEVKRLGDVAILKNGHAFKSEIYTELGIYKVITIANVQDGWMRLDGSNSINSLPMDLQPHQKLEIGDLLLSMTGNVGRVCQVTEGNCLLNQRVGKIVAKNINFDFLHAILSDVAFQKAMTDVAKGGAQPNLSAPDILNYPVNMPVDENEQKAIAAVIFDINSELTTLQARRDKTHALKQGMMQELLTGKIRLLEKY